jgi:hypothetical protein
MDSRRGIALPVAILAVGAVLAGCGTTNSSSSATAPASTAASTPAAAPSASGTGSSGTGSSGTGSSGTAQATNAAGAGSGTGTAAWCTAAQLKISYTDNSQIKQGALDGMSHHDSVVMVTNISSASCETGGYPGVAALDSSGTQIKQAARATDTSKTITLAPGAVASAMVSANSASCDKPVTVAGLLVIAPNERTSVRLGTPGTFCLASLQIGTLKPGNAAGLKL